jgi:beta-phosphoglucomutase-like phosphatase (HAD superfamily)
MRVVLCSSMRRGREGRELVGFCDEPIIDGDLVEWNYGEYEGLTCKQIHEVAWGWLIYSDLRSGDEASASQRLEGGDRARKLEDHAMVKAVLDNVLGRRPDVLEQHSCGSIQFSGSKIYDRRLLFDAVAEAGHTSGPGWLRVGCPLVTGERSMPQPESRRVITRDQYDAVLLDLDGVITDTANLHAACWKQMFDEYLQKRAAQRGEIFRPSISPETTGSMWTGGPASTAFATFSHRAASNSSREARTTVVTSSQNCTTVLKAAKLDAFFDVRVDGNMIHAQQLAGKPAPDTFLIAAMLLGVEPRRTVVIEDAISGVQAGFNGNFGLVIGIARKGTLYRFPLTYQGQMLEVEIGIEKVEYALRDGECLVIRHETEEVKLTR